MTTKYYLPKLFQAEHEAAAYLAKLIVTPMDKIEPITTGLSKLQPDAVRNACQNSVSILTGPPGTGKTTTTKMIVESLKNAGFTNGIIACPTAKAAKRAEEVVNYDNAGNRSDSPIEAVTVHRLLEFSGKTGGFTRDWKNPLQYDFIVMDEFSMQGMGMLASFLSSVKPGKTRVIFCGDHHQLPSVEPGNIARDLIASGVIPTIELDHIFRQGANSGIVYNAMRILRGESICKADPRTGEDFTDFYFVPRNTEEDSFKTLIDYICDKIPTKLQLDAKTDIQALSPGKKSTVGTKNINDVLRERMTEGKVGKQGFKVGDKVINRKNNYELEIVNGDVGVVKAFDGNGVLVDFGIGGTPREVNITGEAVASLFLAYCYTIHSSQGSEYPAVLIPIHKCHYQLLFRNLIYTGMTRGKQLTVLIGDPLALSRCIHNNAADRRETGFLSAIHKYCSK